MLFKKQSTYFVFATHIGAFGKQDWEMEIFENSFVLLLRKMYLRLAQVVF